MRKKIGEFLKSRYGRLLEHYAAIFAAAVGTSLLASSQHLGGLHGLHALAAFCVGAGSVALKAGYDALRAVALPAVLGWLRGRISKQAAKK